VRVRAVGILFDEFPFKDKEGAASAFGEGKFASKILQCHFDGISAMMFG